MTSITLPGGDHLILHGLSAPEGERGCIERRHRTGRRRWIVFPPMTEAQDAFVSMMVQDGTLIADSFQGLCVRIALDTGTILDRTFVK